MNTTTPSQVPAAPTPVLNIASSWRGTSADSQGVTIADWTVTQTGGSIGGTVHTNAPDPTHGSCNSSHRYKSGTINGTVSGNLLTMTLQFAAGTAGDPTPICSARMTGAAHARVMAASAASTRDPTHADRFSTAA